MKREASLTGRSDKRWEAISAAAGHTTSHLAPDGETPEYGDRLSVDAESLWRDRERIKSTFIRMSIDE